MDSRMIYRIFKCGDCRRLIFRGQPPAIILAVIVALALICDMSYAEVSDFSSLGHQTQLVYRDGHSSRWIMHRSFLESHLSFQKMGLDWQAGLHHFEPSGDLRWGYYGHESSAPSPNDDDNGGRLSGRVYLFEPYTSLSLISELPSGYIRGRVEIRYRRDDRIEFGGKAWVRPVSFVAAYLGLERYYPFPDYSELFYLPFSADDLVGAEGGKLFWNVPASKVDAGCVLKHQDRMALDYRYVQTGLLSERPEYGDFPSSTYTAQLFGGWKYHEAGLTIKTGREWENRLQYRKISLATDSLTAHDGGLKFGHFGVVEGDGYMWSYGVDYKTINLALDWGRIRGRLQGSIEAWPFLEDLYRFLGERRHFIAEGSVRWFHAASWHGLYSNAWFGIEGGIDYVRISPEARYATWRPYMFGWGIDDLRVGQLDLIRADLIRVKLRPEIKWSYFNFLLDISQWAPVSDAYRSENRSGADSGAGSADGLGDGRDVWGGFSISVTVSAAI